MKASQKRSTNLVDMDFYLIELVVVIHGIMTTTRGTTKEIVKITTKLIRDIRQ
jgi:hypothetical protein